MKNEYHNLQVKKVATVISETGLPGKVIRVIVTGNLFSLYNHDSIQSELNPKNKESYKKIRAFNDTLIRKALELNGTITGEHGVGLHKKEYLLEQHPDNIPVMKSIKRTMDPNNIMNPGKIFDLN